MALNINEARKLVLDLGKPKLGLYWVDFLASYAVAWGGFAMAYPHPLSSFAFWGWILVSILGLYRAMAFTHELAHFRQRLGSFRVLWNALAGMPMAFPSFMYVSSHSIHHNPKTYGTKADGEYISFHTQPRWLMVGYLLSSFWAPPLLILRFAVLYPLSYFSPALRKFVVERGSAVVITLDHVSPWPGPNEKREWFIMETACAVFWIAVLTLCAVGIIPWRVLGVAYVSMAGALFLNGVRTLAAHRFANDGRVMTIEEQLLDSVNVVNRFPHSLVSTLGAPVGLRFHALHHLFPFLPYHSLGEAHRRLAGKLPTESSYHDASEASIVYACVKIWNRHPTPKAKVAEPVPSSSSPTPSFIPAEA